MQAECIEKRKNRHLDTYFLDDPHFEGVSTNQGFVERESCQMRENNFSCDVSYCYAAPKAPSASRSASSMAPSPDGGVGSLPGPSPASSNFLLITLQARANTSWRRRHVVFRSRTLIWRTVMACRGCGEAIHVCRRGEVDMPRHPWRICCVTSAVFSVLTCGRTR